jgi:thiamine pyrophosphate-dependent acetolactate synthase large subunit-like protein
MELREPEIDMVGLARSFGVEAETLTEPDQIESALQQSPLAKRPRLLNIPIARTLSGPGGE